MSSNQSTKKTSSIGGLASIGAKIVLAGVVLGSQDGAKIPHSVKLVEETSAYTYTEESGYWENCNDAGESNGDNGGGAADGGGEGDGGGDGGGEGGS